MCSAILAKIVFRRVILIGLPVQEELNFTLEFGRRLRHTKSNQVTLARSNNWDADRGALNSLSPCRDCLASKDPLSEDFIFDIRHNSRCSHYPLCWLLGGSIISQQRHCIRRAQQSPGVFRPTGVWHVRLEQRDAEVRLSEHDGQLAAPLQLVPHLLVHPLRHHRHQLLINLHQGQAIRPQHPEEKVSLSPIWGILCVGLHFCGWLSACLINQLLFWNDLNWYI